MGTQADILADLHAITDDVTCRPVAVPNHRPVPHVALWTGIPPGEIVSAQLEQPTRGAYIDPANERVLRNFTLDPRDPKTLTASVPAGLRGGRRERVVAPLRALLREKSGPCTRCRSRPPGTVRLTDSGRATPLRPPVTA